MTTTNEQALNGIFESIENSVKLESIKNSVKVSEIDGKPYEEIQALISKVKEENSKSQELNRAALLAEFKRLVFDSHRHNRALLHDLWIARKRTDGFSLTFTERKTSRTQNSFQDGYYSQPTIWSAQGLKDSFFSAAFAVPKAARIRARVDAAKLVLKENGTPSVLIDLMKDAQILSLANKLQGITE